MEGRERRGTLDQWERDYGPTLRAGGTASIECFRHMRSTYVGLDDLESLNEFENFALNLLPQADRNKAMIELLREEAAKLEAKPKKRRWWPRIFGG